jgi:hypothetical protein
MDEAISDPAPVARTGDLGPPQIHLSLSAFAR